MTTADTHNQIRAAGFKAESCNVPGVNPTNATMTFDGFHLSYNPYSHDYGSETTAIVLGGRVFFVLNGNHGEQLALAAKSGGVRACVDYFLAHLPQANAMSEHMMAAGLVKNPFQLIATTLEVLGKETFAVLVNRLKAAGSGVQ